MKGLKRRTITNIILTCVLGVGLVISIHAFQGNWTLEKSAPVQNLEWPKIQSSRPEKVVQHLGYTVSFNTDWCIPNWVAYELTAEEVAGIEPRGNNFVPDPDIFGSASTDDYKNSGYDRGHMAPAADMKWSKQAITESFYMSNICPQNKNLNKGDWKDLEVHIRSMATTYDHIYITCGPIVSKKPQTIGYIHRVAIPDAFFKAVLRKKGDTWSAIGFMMPNQAGHKKLSSYAMSIEELEFITDVDLFYNLPNDVEEQVETTFNLSDWNL